MGASLAAATAASASAMSLHQQSLSQGQVPPNYLGLPTRHMHALQQGGTGSQSGNPGTNRKGACGVGTLERGPGSGNAAQRPNQLDRAAAHSLRMPPPGPFLTSQLPAPSTIAALTHAALPFSSSLSLSASNLSLPMFFPYDFSSFATSAQTEVQAGGGGIGGGSLPRQEIGEGSVAAGLTGQQQSRHPYPLLMALGRAPITGRPAVPLFLNSDTAALSAYQCLVRKQIELFEAGTVDVESNAQGRNRPIVLGQVGIRCRHCSHLNPRERSRGATYYPAQLQGLYQACQNLSLTHLATHCQLIPGEIRSELEQLRKRKSSAGGGKKYWADAAKVLGVYEDGDGLRFASR
jgi:hypothetical protein